MPSQASDNNTITLPFEKFWGWLQSHRNCIIRAGTPDAILFDYEDYHWDILREDEMTHVLQLVRGKDLVGEVIVMASDIVFVQGATNEAEEHVFECVVDTPAARDVAYHFIMAHGFEEERLSGRRWTH